ncbi:MAG: hypothetical protein ABIJ92_04655 [Candidatus Aenigmatarchaeota archaeon]
MMRKGVEDFMILLIVAIILLIGMFLITPFLGPVVVPENETVIANFSLGTVGFVTESATRTESLGYMRVGEPQLENIKSIFRSDIRNGYIGETTEEFTINVPEWLMESRRGARIKFEIVDTNVLGDLHIKWNGKDFFGRKAGINTYDVTIDKDFVRASNDVEIYADGPGLFFWASNAYNIRNMDVGIEYGPAKIVSFDLLGSELQTFSKAEISFFALGGSTLRIKVNGLEIYTDTPRGFDTAELQFGDVPLKTGKNIISFEVVGDGVVTLEETELKIFLLSNEVVRTRSYDMPEEKYKLIENGQMKAQVKYYVNVIVRDGLLTIKQNGHTLTTEHPDQGWNTVDFTADQVTAGENQIIFSGAGNWDIEDVKIELVK